VTNAQRDAAAAAAAAAGAIAFASKQQSVGSGQKPSPCLIDLIVVVAREHVRIFALKDGDEVVDGLTVRRVRHQLLEVIAFRERVDRVVEDRYFVVVKLKAYRRHKHIIHGHDRCCCFRVQGAVSSSVRPASASPSLSG
jgi:uncharacterized membrane protein